MSLRDFSYAEEWYYEHDIIFRQAIKEECRQLGIALRMPSNGQAHSGIDAYVMSRGLATGHAPTRTRRRWRKKDRTYSRELEEIYA